MLLDRLTLAIPIVWSGIAIRVGRRLELPLPDQVKGSSGSAIVYAPGHCARVPLRYSLQLGKALDHLRLAELVGDCRYLQESVDVAAGQQTPQDRRKKTYSTFNWVREPSSPALLEVNLGLRQILWRVDNQDRTFKVPEPLELQR